MYDYSLEKKEIFTEYGQKLFLKIRDKANSLCTLAGATSVSKVISGCTGSSWTMLACIDRLVELNEFRYLNQEFQRQDWIIIKKYGED